MEPEVLLKRPAPLELLGVDVHGLHKHPLACPTTLLFEGHMLLTREEKEEALEYWKPRLGLSAWRITLCQRPACDMDGADANCKWIASRRLADITFVAEGTGSTGDEMSIRVNDDEEALVHEMLHICFSTAHDLLDKNISEIEDRVAMEQPIEQLSLALVRLRRATSSRLSFDDRLVENN